MTTYTVTSGQIKTGLTLSQDDILNISKGGIASGTIVSYSVFGDEHSGFYANDGIQNILSGGIAISTVINGGTENISAGGIERGAIVSGYDYYDDYYDDYYGYYDYFPGTQFISAGGTANGTIVNNDGEVTISAGGIANGTVVNSGGSEIISAGGVASGSIINSGGTLEMDLTSGSKVTGANGEYVINGITVHSGAHIELTLESGVAVSGLIINSNDSLNIHSGGKANGTVVNSGGSEIISAGGVASDSIINSGGTLEMGLTSSPKVMGTNGEYVINGITVHSGADIKLTLESSVTVSGLIINSAGLLDIHSGGKAIGTVVNYYGYETISAGGIASGTVVNSGGTEVVYSGGIASGTIVNSGGIEVVSAGGIASGTIVNSGGTEVVDGGGIASGTILNSGGTLEFNSSANITNLTLKPGATLDYVFGTVTAASVNKLGQLVVTSGGVVRDTIGLKGDYSGVHFATSDDGTYGTLITESNPTANIASFLKKLSSISDTNKYIIADTTANIFANLNTLQTSINKLAIISQTDSATTLAISAAQSSTDHAVLAKIIGAYNLKVTGTAGADTLFDTVYSHATLIGGKGIDTFNVTGTDTITDLGKGGADILKVSAGGIANATIDTAWTATADTINNGTVNITTAGLAVNLSAVTKGTSGYKITDTGGVTTLIGSALKDLIIGGTGNDLIVGRLGNDTLTGGNGNDTFVFNTPPNNKTNVDLITDFVSGKDHLQLSKAIFAGLNTAAGTGNGTVLKGADFN